MPCSRWRQCRQRCSVPRYERNTVNSVLAAPPGALHSSTHTCWAEPALQAGQLPCHVERYWTNRKAAAAQRVARIDAWGSLLKLTVLHVHEWVVVQLVSSPMQDTAREADAARRAAEDSAAGQAAALAATRRRADTYREENRALLANYDDWLRTLVGSRIRTPPQSVANTLGVHSCGNSMSPFLSMAHAANA